MKTTIYAPGKEVYVASPNKLTKTFINYAIIHGLKVTYFDDKEQPIEGASNMYDSVEDFYRGIESEMIDVDNKDCYLKEKKVDVKFHEKSFNYFDYYGYKYINGDAEREVYHGSKAKVKKVIVNSKAFYRVYILDAEKGVYPTREMALGNEDIEIIDGTFKANEVRELSDEQKTLVAEISMVLRRANEANIGFVYEENSMRLYYYNRAKWDLTGIYDKADYIDDYKDGVKPDSIDLKDLQYNTIGCLDTVNGAFGSDVLEFGKRK